MLLREGNFGTIWVLITLKPSMSSVITTQQKSLSAPSPQSKRCPAPRPWGLKELIFIFGFIWNVDFLKWDDFKVDKGNTSFVEKKLTFYSKKQKESFCYRWHDLFFRCKSLYAFNFRENSKYNIANYCWLSFCFGLLTWHNCPMQFTFLSEKNRAQISVKIVLSSHLADKEARLFSHLWSDQEEPSEAKYPAPAQAKQFHIS